MSNHHKAGEMDGASVTPSEVTTAVAEPDLQRFTATGRPMPKSDISSLGNMPTEMTNQAYQNLPWRYTDDDMISVPIPIDDDDEAATPEISSDNAAAPRRKSWIGKLGDKITGKDVQKPKFKVVRMTRGEYLAKYARDENGKYIGTDPVPGKCPP